MILMDHAADWIMTYVPMLLMTWLNTENLIPTPIHSLWT